MVRWLVRCRVEVAPAGKLATVVAAESVTEHEEVTIRASDQGWLYRENTDPIEWARTPELTDAELATDSAG